MYNWEPWDNEPWDPGSSSGPRHSSNWNDLSPGSADSWEWERAGIKLWHVLAFVGICLSFARHLSANYWRASVNYWFKLVNQYHKTIVNLIFG